MYGDSYYHILLLIFYYGLRKGDPALKENTLLIILFKIWNGRKEKHIKF